MMAEHDLNEREALVLEAVVRTFVQTASPAASRTVARQFDLGVSPATIRNTMSDLTRKGYLTQPHASAGRMPTDKAYRYYVDTLMRPDRLTSEETRRIEAALDLARTSAEERILARAVKALSVVTQELGVGLAPRMEEGVLEKIDLVGVSRDRILIVLAVRSGPVRTIFVEGEWADSDEALASVAGFLNERLAGQTLREIRETYRDRLADGPAEHADIVNIFLEQAEGLFSARPSAGEDVLLGPTAGLAAQPEFADRDASAYAPPADRAARRTRGGSARPASRRHRDLDRRGARGAAARRLQHGHRGVRYGERARHDRGDRADPHAIRPHGLPGGVHSAPALDADAGRLRDRPRHGPCIRTS